MRNFWGFNQRGFDLMEVKLKQLDKDLPIPRYAHDGDAGCDLYSRIDIILEPGERALIPTGIALSIPLGYAGFIQPRSGLALKHGISILNTPGLIDSHYRGEICVILINQDTRKSFEVKRGDKIAQLIIQRIENITFRVVSELDATGRGSGGFGSSGR
ncbi:MAG: dUTP diphosphatase [Actinomycetota bacterium]